MMTSISGTIRIGEAQATMPATGKRQRGSLLIFYVVMLAVLFGTGFIGLVLSIPAKVDAGIGFFIGMLGGLFIYHRWSSVLTVWRYRKTLIARGVPPEIAVQWELAPDELVYRVGEVTTRASWHALTELFHEKGWWIAMVQGTPIFAPDRFFADDAAQRAFVRELLSHMSEEARGRSKDAVKFAGTGP